MKINKSDLLKSPLIIVSIYMTIFLLNACSEKLQQTSNQHFIQLGNRNFSGILHDNISNRQRQGSGFTPLIHSLYPNQNLYHDDAVGLNFEHIMNGTAADAPISMFTPRKDSCIIKQINDSSVVVIHPAKYSSWHIGSKMTYTFSGANYIDLEFIAILKKDKYPLGYVGFMWASYMNRTIDRRIYFSGSMENGEEWIAFGEDLTDGFETGTIGYSGSEPLPYENEAKTLNIIEHPEKKFTSPFYYGLTHGSGNIEAPDDTMVYIMMFDQKESIRFAMWNFIRNSEGEADTHSPAWDWQYIIRKPELNKAYRYRARIVYKPYAGRADIVKEYENWALISGEN